MKCHTNNKFPGNHGFTEEFYIHLSNELASILSDVYNSWGKLVIMGVTSRTETIFAICKKGG